VKFSGVVCSFILLCSIESDAYSMKTERTGIKQTCKNCQFAENLTSFFSKSVNRIFFNSCACVVLRNCYLTVKFHRSEGHKCYVRG
jgi:hypothetical protein